MCGACVPRRACGAVRRLLWAAENDHRYGGRQFPQAGVLAARGYAGVVLDAFGVLPFAESSLDLVHSAWTYHDGLPTRTLYELHRVLRPGGYLLLRQMLGGGAERAQLQQVAAFGARLNWTSVGASPHGRVCAGAGVVAAFRMPLPRAWRRQAFYSR